MFSSTKFCLDNGVVTQVDVDRLHAKLAGQERVHALAGEFGMTPERMAPFCFDGGLVFQRVILLEGDASGIMWTPPPVPDAGWDVVSDDPAEEDFYRQMNYRLCDVLGVPRVVLRHFIMTDQQRLVARDTGTIARMVEAMRRHGLEFVPEHWPTASSPECYSPPGRCIVSREPAAAAQLVAV